MGNASLPFLFVLRFPCPVFLFLLFHAVVSWYARYASLTYRNAFVASPSILNLYLFFVAVMRQ